MLQRSYVPMRLCLNFVSLGKVTPFEKFPNEHPKKKKKVKNLSQAATLTGLYNYVKCNILQFPAVAFAEWIFIVISPGFP